MSDSSQGSFDDALELERLWQINREYEAQIQELKSQCAESMSVASKLTEVIRENNNLKQAVFDLKNQNEDLTKRLEISISTNSSSEKEAAQKLRNAEADHLATIAELQAKIDFINSERSIDKQTLKKVENQCEVRIRGVQSETASLKSQISKILGNASYYFNRNFETVGDLIEFLNYPEPVPPPEKPDEFILQNEELGRRLKKSRAKCDRLTQEKQELQLKVAELQQQIETDATNTALEFEKLKNQFEKQEREVAMLRVSRERDEILPPPVKKRNQACQCDPSDDLDQVTSLQRLNLDCNAEIEEKVTAISMLEMKLVSVGEELKNKEMERVAAVNKAKLLKNSRNELQTQLNRARHELDQVHLDMEKMRCEVDSVLNESCVKESKLRMQIEESESKYASLLGAVKKLEKIVSMQKAEVQSVTEARDTLVRLVLKQNRLLEAVPVVHAEPETKFVERVVEVEPSFEWDFSGIPEELRRILSEVAANSGAPVCSRVRNVSLVVGKWIQNMKTNHETEIAELKAKMSEVTDSFIHYQRTIARCLGSVDSMTANEICSVVTEISEEITSLKRKMFILQADQARFCASLEATDLNDALSKLKDLKCDMKFLAERVTVGESKARALKRQLKGTTCVYEKKFEQTIGSFETALENAKEQNLSLRRELETLQKQNEDLLEQLQAFHITEPEKSESDSGFEPQECKVTDTQEHESKIYELQSKIDSLTKNLESWKEAAHSAQERMTLNQRAFQTAIEKSEHKIEEQRATFIKEMAQAKEKSDRLIDEIRNQVLDGKETIAKLQKQIEIDQQKYKVAQSLIERQKHELEKELMNRNYQNEALERSKKLMEIQIQAKVIALESQLAQTVEEQKHALEKQKKNLISKFISSFSQYADLTGGITEQAFLDCIFAVKDRLDKYKSREETIRRLVHAKDSETVDDATVRFIIEHHPNL